ncbi:MAG: TonB-dependent receptor [Bryobacteraceae bacterium]
MRVFLAFVCAVFTAVLAYGQGANGTITGTVLDPSGAIVAGAEIRVTNTATGLIFNSVSTATGNYVAPQLPVGTYDLNVTLSGFKAYNRVNLGLAATQTLRIDVSLEVGSAAESVTVTAEATLLKTETGGLTHNVTVSQMKNLPILVLGGTGSTNTVGFRDPYSLAQMIPGVSYTNNSVMIVNGNPDDTVQFRVEGQTAGNTGAFRGFTAQSQPSVDAVEEVAVQTSNYAAEFGTAGGGIFNVTMKSGTNQYHGSFYDYAGNEALNAYQPYTGLRNVAKRHDYGATFGGPVSIPKLYSGKNRTFFFFSFEQFREKLNINSTVATVPTAAYRAGDFSGLWTANANRLLREGTANYVDPLGATVLDRTLFDPLTERTVTCPATGANCTANQSVQVRSAFAGNLIPVTRFDPVAVNVLKLVPLPEGPNAAKGQIGENFQRAWRASRRSDLPSFKIDQTIGSKGRLSGYYQFNKLRAPYSFPNGGMEGLPEPITAARGSFIVSHSTRVNYDHTITPTVLLHVGAGMFTWNFDDHAPFLDTTGPLNQQTLLGLQNRGINRQFPVLTTATSVALGGLNVLGQGAQANQFERRPSGVVNLSWVRNNHSYKFGAEYRLEKYPQRGFTNAAGNYTFNTNYTTQSALQGRVLSQGATGFELASFLLGGTSGATLAVPLVAGISKSQSALFAQDTWKVTRKFTLDYGVRWDYGTYASEQFGRYGSFSPTVVNPAAGGHPGGTIYEATCQCKFASNYPYAIGPRLGAAYQINSKTVLRGGYGIVYSTVLNASGAAVNSATAGTPGFGQIVGQFKDGVPAQVRPQFPNFAADAGQPSGAVVASPTLLDPNAGRPARQQQWSIGLQREIHRNLVVEATYVANRGSWWAAPVANLGPLNVMSEQLLGRYGFSLNNAADGILLAKQISALTTADRTTLATKGVTVTPYAGYSTGQIVRQALVPFPQYNNTIAPSQAPVGNTWYDGLQLSVIQRFSHGLSFNFNYTASKALELMSSPDVFNRKLGKDLQATDIPQQIRMSAEYQVPKLRNSGITGLSNPVVSYILGDWGLGWFFQYQSAPILARPANQGSQPISQWLGRGPGPAQYVEGQSLWSTNWVDYDGKQHTDPIDINCHCFDPTKNVVLNRDAWVSIPNGQWGAQQTAIRQFRGIRQPQENLNLSRNFRFTERVVLHIRVEFQNALNRTRLPQPSVATFTASANKFTSGAFAGLYSGGFGTIVPTSGTAGSRTGTMIARLTF